MRCTWSVPLARCVFIADMMKYYVRKRVSFQEKLGSRHPSTSSLFGQIQILPFQLSYHFTMNLQEKRVWPLAGSTTCYSGGHAVIRDERSLATIHVGTSLHTIQLQVETPINNNNNKNMHVSYQSVPQSASPQSVCVGYDVCEEGYEVIALLSYDPEAQEDHTTGLSSTSIAALTGSEQRGSQNHNTATTHNNNNVDNSDTMTVASTGTSVTASTNTTSNNPAAAVPKSIMEETSSSFSTLQPRQPASTNSTPSDSTIKPNNDSPRDEGSSTKKQQLSNTHARLVLQKQQPLQWSSPSSSETLNPAAPLASRQLVNDFRPLAVKVGVLRLFQEDAYQESWVPVVWCGNSNSPRLHCFIYDDPNNDDDEKNNDDDDHSEHSTLTSLDLDPQEAFAFTTPITAIDFVQVNNNNLEQEESSCLAVSCQDGTVRVIHFSAVSVSSSSRDDNNNNHKDRAVSQQQGKCHWVNLQYETITVDGPIVCNHLIQKKNNGSTLSLIAGSLCGYVFSMSTTTGGTAPRTISNDSQDHDNGGSSNKETQQQETGDDKSWKWDEPKLVVEGLWNSHLSSPDLVLTVHGYEDFVAIGTHSGRCLLYQSTNTPEEGEEAFECVWQCRLPYSVHKICFWFDTVGTIQMVVTTRKSIHLFQQIAVGGKPALTAESSYYKPQLALDRLANLLQSHAIPK